ncbi:MAG: murein transglycosylase A [Sphingomonas sp.]
MTVGPAIASLPITRDQAVRALGAFRLTCPSLVRRTDTSGLTRGSDWQPVCSAADAAADSEALDFFRRSFESVQVADGKAFATGYFEPEIRGSRTRSSAYQVPIYGRPSDLVEVDLGLFSDDLKGKRIRGRVEASAFVPYPERAQIDAGAIARTAPIIAYAADEAELFFLQIQGSGRLRLPNGEVIRLGYDSQNGRDYTGIGALLRQRGLLQPGQTSMQGIVDWLHTHPADAKGIMNENKSYVFFREQQGNPRGALGFPVTGGVSAAADPKFVPLGAPVFLSLDRADASRLWVAQDTGGAIKGANRFDTFWGAGDEARAIAGGMAGRGSAFLLLPIGTLARLTAEGPRGGSSPNR